MTRKVSKTRRPRNPARSSFWVGTTILIAAAAGCESWQGHPNGGSADGAVPAAVVDQHVITLTQVDERIRQVLFDEAFGDDEGSLYAARRDTAEEMVEEYLLNQAAAEAGQSPEAWLDAQLEAAPAVSEQEITELFEQARDRLPPGAEPETYMEPLRAFLEGQRMASVLEGLREKAAVTLNIPRLRVQVEPIGPSLGPDSASVTLVEFSDFQCPFCSRAVPTIKALREKYPDDLRVVYRHMPLSFHANARPAAIAAACADAQGLFWPYHDRLFEQQQALSGDDLMAHAEAVGLEKEAFATCLEDPATAATVDADSLAARDAGVTGTPAFFVNGVFLSGAQPVEVFEAIIEEERVREN